MEIAIRNKEGETTAIVSSQRILYIERKGDVNEPLLYDLVVLGGTHLLNEFIKGDTWIHSDNPHLPVSIKSATIDYSMGTITVEGTQTLDLYLN